MCAISLFSIIKVFFCSCSSSSARNYFFCWNGKMIFKRTKMTFTSIRFAKSDSLFSSLPSFSYYFFRKSTEFPFLFGLFCEKNNQHLTLLARQKRRENTVIITSIFFFHDSCTAEPRNYLIVIFRKCCSCVDAGEREREKQNENITGFYRFLCASDV